MFGVAQYTKQLKTSGCHTHPKPLDRSYRGIQTVKEDFELTARWKWQDRYRNFIQDQSTVLGATSERRKFLNQEELWFCGLVCTSPQRRTHTRSTNWLNHFGNVTSPLSISRPLPRLTRCSTFNGATK